MKFTTKQYHRMKILQLDISTQNAQLADMVYDKPKAFAAIKQLIELRQILSTYGVKSKKDLETVLENSVTRT